MAHQNRDSVAHPGNGGMRHRHLATKIYFCGASLRCATEIPTFCGAPAVVRHRNISVAHQNSMRHRIACATENEKYAPQNSLNVFSIFCCLLYKYVYIIENTGISHYRKYRYITENRKYRYILQEIQLYHIT